MMFVIIKIFIKNIFALTIVFCSCQWILIYDIGWVSIGLMWSSLFPLRCFTPLFQNMFGPSFVNRGDRFLM